MSLFVSLCVFLGGLVVCRVFGLSVCLTYECNIWVWAYVSLCVSLCLFVSLLSTVTTQSTVVSYPVNGLDLTGIVAESGDGTAPIYDLFAVSNHSGGLGGGHYTAYGKNPKTSKWYVLCW